MEILGKANAWVQRAITAQAGTGEFFLIEGPKAVWEAVAAGRDLPALFVRQGDDGPWKDGEMPPGSTVYLVPDRLFDRMAGVRSPQGLLAVARRPLWRLEDVLGRSLVLVLDGIQDPGNVGALIRAAAAFGVGGVVAGKECAHPFTAKAVRASAGTVWLLPVVESQEWEAPMRRSGFSVAVAEAMGGEEPSGLAWEGKWALVLGNEGHGPGVTGDRRLTVHLQRGVESLNVAVAGAVLLHALSPHFALHPS